MKKQTLAILSIIAIGSLSSIAYGVSTVISDSGITTPAVTVGALTVTGTCTGCGGGGEGSFSTWSTLFNGTVPGSVGCQGSSIYVNNTGTVILTDNCPNTFIVNPSGITVQINSPTGSVPTPISSTQSGTGLYQIGYDTNTIKVYKNNILLQSIGLDINNFGASFGGSLSINISPNGKYIAVQNEDVSTTLDRLVIFQGS